MDKKYPEPVVGTFIIKKSNQLLLMKSHKWSDKYVVPGGHVELGETIEQAIKREAKEETGLDVENPTFICLWEFINEDEFIKKKHMIFLNYRVTTTGEKITLNEEGQEYVWANKEDLPKLNLEKYTKLTLEKHSDKIF